MKRKRKREGDNPKPISTLLGTDAGSIVAEMKLNTSGQVRLGPVTPHLVISKGFGERLTVGFGFIRQVHMDAFNELVGVGAAEACFAFVLLGVIRVLRAAVLEAVKAAHDHFTSRGGTVVLEHVEQRLEEEF